MVEIDLYYIKLFQRQVFFFINIYIDFIKGAAKVLDNF